MPTTNPGQIFLTGCATLENRRPVPHEAIHLHLRHYFLVSSTKQGSLGIGRRDIISMRQLSVVTKHDLSACEDPVCISGAGMVSSVNRDTLSFIIHASQYTSGGESSDDIAIRARLDLNLKWTNPTQRLPHTSALIRFSGTLHHFETFHPPNSTRHVTCAVVALDDITYLPRPSSILKAQPKQTIHTKLKSQAEKYTLEASSSSLSSLPPPSQLGKRKAESSDDEVNEEVLLSVD
ncbi:hypothetical protein EI94DRAFT_1699012 [Lactarius quietus]|nr:hypothetical protein EI94DRAFT_1699012 [Lactarius quietus]